MPEVAKPWLTSQHGTYGSRGQCSEAPPTSPQGGSGGQCSLAPPPTPGLPVQGWGCSHIAYPGARSPQGKPKQLGGAGGGGAVTSAPG